MPRPSGQGLKWSMEEWSARDDNRLWCSLAMQVPPKVTVFIDHGSTKVK